MNLALWRLRVSSGGSSARAKKVTFRGRTITYLDFPSLQLVLREIFLARDYEFRTTNPKPFIVDCGSNIGVAVLFFKEVYPDSRILAFEPDPETFSVLKQNIGTNSLSNVSSHNVALAAKQGQVEFFRDAHRNGALYMSTNDRIVRTISRDGSCQKTIVEAVRLSDHLNQPVDFLKLDTEGAEFDVLRDLAQTGKLRLVREMVVEFHQFSETGLLQDALEILKANGFACRMSANAPTSGNPDALRTFLIRAWQHP